MDGTPAPRYRVNEHTPDPRVIFDRSLGESYVTYARRLNTRGLVQSTGDVV